MERNYERTCKLCKAKFNSKSPRRQICYKDHYLQCPDCGVSVLWNKTEEFHGCKKCNQKRAVKKRKATMLELYGGETTLQSKILTDKVKSTLSDKYGVDNPMKVPEFQNKAQETNLHKYGHRNVMSNPDIAKKSAEVRSLNIDQAVENIKKAWLDKYGVDNISKLPETIDKITDTFMRKYGVKRAVNVPEFRQKMLDSTELRHGSPYYVLTDEYRKSDHFRISKTNEAFRQRLEHANIEYEMEFKIELKCYDFYLPKSKTLIEINPTYTHNIIGNHWNKNGLPADYHRIKTQLATTNGFRCINIWDWDNEDKIMQMLHSPENRVHARECTIYRINPLIGDEFLNKYHLQNSCKGQLLYLGLVYQDELVLLMTFGKPRYSKSHYVELLRFCCNPKYRVVGGVSRLFSYATSEYGLHNIVTYCDLSKFTGRTYELIGMHLDRISPPQEIWSKGDKKLTANLLRKHGYEQLLHEPLNGVLSNEQALLQDGWLPVYDCGQAVYVTQ